MNSVIFDYLKGDFSCLKPF